MTDIVQQVIDADAIIAAVEKRRTCVWYKEVAPFYEGLAQVANMQRFFAEHAAGFHTRAKSYLMRWLALVSNRIKRKRIVLHSYRL